MYSDCGYGYGVLFGVELMKLCYTCGMVVYEETQRECPNCGRITDWNRWMKVDSSKQSRTKSILCVGEKE